jgi:hypothetical protein
MNTNQSITFLRLRILIVGLTLLTHTSHGQNSKNLLAKVNTLATELSTIVSEQDVNLTKINQAINMVRSSEIASYSTRSFEITLQENETGFCGVDGDIETEHSGYTGNGYVNTDNDSGNGIDCKTHELRSGIYILSVESDENISNAQLIVR